MPLIETDALTRRFGTFTALEGLTLAVEPGVIGLVGANGAGTATLIKILLGLLPASAGRASVLGHDVSREGETVRGLVGYMPEHDCLPPDVTATELVVHLGRISGLPPTAARERAADVLRHVGLYEERYRAIGTYSTGMKQRVKLAQALAHDPKLVLLDEPTNGLDPAGRDEMLDLVRRIGTEFGISVLVTSHLLGELERVCDHVVVIDGGRLLRSSSTRDVLAESGVLAVEVDERADDVVAALAARGVTARAARTTIETTAADDAVLDAVRDVVADLGVGLVRLEHRRHRMAELFETPAPPPAASAARTSRKEARRGSRTA